MKKFTFLVLFSLTLVQFSCSKDDDQELKYENLKSLEIREYEMQVPDYFIFKEDIGFDSYVGTISGNGIEIKFDYGIYTSPPDINPEKYEIEYETSNSIEKYIIIPYDPKEGVGIHIRNLNNIRLENYVALNMVTQNLSKEQQNLVVKIFESVHFVN